MKIYISKEGKKTGPLTEKEIKGMIWAGILKPEDLGMKEGETNWKPLRVLLDDSQEPAIQTSSTPVQVQEGQEKKDLEDSTVDFKDEKEVKDVQEGKSLKSTKNMEDRLKNVKTFDDKLKDIVANYREKISNKKIFFSDDIPVKKLNNAMSMYAKLEGNEHPLMLIDDSIFGSAKVGTVLTNKRLYSRNDDFKTYTINLSEIKSVNFEWAVTSWLLINGTKFIQFNGVKESTLQTLNVMIKDIINQFHLENEYNAKTAKTHKEKKEVLNGINQVISNQIKTVMIIDSKTSRIRGLIVVIGAPIAVVVAIAAWVFLGALNLEDPDNTLITLLRMVAAPLCIMTIIAAPIYFIAGFIQLVSGNPNRIVRILFESNEKK